MKKIILLFLMISLTAMGQQTQTIKLNQNIRAKKNVAKSLVVYDFRPQQEIGTIEYAKKTFDFKFPQETLKSSIENWFDEDNKNKSEGTSDYVITINKIEVSSEAYKKTKKHKIQLEFASFNKKQDRFYFIDKVEKTIFLIPEPNLDIPSAVALRISANLSRFINDTYTHPINTKYISEDKLNDYKEVYKSFMPGFQDSNFPDGVYSSFTDFFYKKPDEGLHVKKNKKGEVTGIRDENDLYVGNRKIFGFVEESKPFVVAPIGFVELEKDEHGYYVYSSKKLLNPTNNNDAIIMGGLVGGIVGGALVAVITSSAQKKANDNEVRYNIYVDPLTGAFLFKDE